MGTPPPLPRIDVALVLASLARHLGDPAFARYLKRAILENTEEGTEPLVVMRTPFGPVSWDYHVAPMVCVRDAGGQIQKMVFDPSIAKEPLTIDQWRAVQGGPAGQHAAETDATPFHYRPDSFTSGDRIGVVREDPTHEVTRASLVYFSVQRDLEAGGL